MSIKQIVLLSSILAGICPLSGTPDSLTRNCDALIEGITVALQALDLQAQSDQGDQATDANIRRSNRLVCLARLSQALEDAKTAYLAAKDQLRPQDQRLAGLSPLGTGFKTIMRHAEQAFGFVDQNQYYDDANPLRELFLCKAALFECIATLLARGFQAGLTYVQMQTQTVVKMVALSDQVGRIDHQSYLHHVTALAEVVRHNPDASPFRELLLCKAALYECIVTLLAKGLTGGFTAAEIETLNKIITFSAQVDRIDDQPYLQRLTVVAEAVREQRIIDLLVDGRRQVLPAPPELLAQALEARLEQDHSPLDREVERILYEIPHEDEPIELAGPPRPVAPEFGSPSRSSLRTRPVRDAQLPRQRSQSQNPFDPINVNRPTGRACSTGAARRRGITLDPNFTGADFSPSPLGMRARPRPLPAQWTTDARGNLRYVRTPRNRD